TLPRFRPLLERVDALFLGEDELELPRLQESPESALRRLRGGRLRYVAWKRGAAGGLLYDAHADQLIPWGGYAGKGLDPTRCGDSCAAAFVPAILDGEEAQAAIQRGLAAASFTLAGWGASALLEASPAAAQARLRELQGLRTIP